MSPLLLLLLVVLALAVVGGIALAVRSKSDYTKANEVVPGTASPAPASWAGAHTPEARLHRRLRDAVAAIRTGSTSATATGFRTSLEQAAISLDERLVAVAALSERTRGEPLAQIESAVVALEDAAAALATSGGAAGELGPGVIDEVTQHLRFLTEARQELDRLPTDRPDQRGATG